MRDLCTREAVNTLVSRRLKHQTSSPDADFAPPLGPSIGRGFLSLGLLSRVIISVGPAHFLESHWLAVASFFVKG